MSDLAISQNAIIPGSTVKHPAYGTGKVVTVGYDWRRPSIPTLRHAAQSHLDTHTV